MHINWKTLAWNHWCILLRIFWFRSHILRQQWTLWLDWLIFGWLQKIIKKKLQKEKKCSSCRIIHLIFFYFSYVSSIFPNLNFSFYWEIYCLCSWVNRGVCRLLKVQICINFVLGSILWYRRKASMYNYLVLNYIRIWLNGLEQINKVLNKDACFIY